MLLHPSKLAQAVQLTQTGTTVPLKDTAGKFSKLFSDAGERFRARCALVFLLQQGGFSILEDRVCSYYLLAFSYNWEHAGGFPFLKFFIQVCC